MWAVTQSSSEDDLVRTVTQRIGVRVSFFVFIDRDVIISLAYIIKFSTLVQNVNPHQYSISKTEGDLGLPSAD